jgi:phycoerythrin-associated linker protein
MTLWVTTIDPVELRSNATEEDLQAVIRAVYKQVLGNAHVMESQRLTSAESYLRNGDVSVRGFVRMVAQSSLYQSLFFESSSPYRFVELNCKHLLGRAPHDQAEISSHVQTYNSHGYSVEIDSYIDSDEYMESFGENVVPFNRGTQSQLGQKNVGFNRAFTLMRGDASHSGGTVSLLLADVAGNRATKIKPPARGGGAQASTSKRFRIVAAKTKGGPQSRNSKQTVTVSYAQLSDRIQGIQRAGGKILSITESV